MRQLNFDETQAAFEEIEKNASENVVLLSIREDRTSEGKISREYYIIAETEYHHDVAALRVLRFGKQGWIMSEESVLQMSEKKMTLMEAFLEYDYPTHAGDIYFLNEYINGKREYEYSCECMQALARYNDPVVLALSNEEYLEIFDLLREGDYLLIFES